MTLTDTSTEAEKQGPAGTNAISVIVPIEDRTANLDYWVSTRRQFLQRKGLKEIEQTEIQMGGQPAICLGGDIPRDIMHLQTDSVSFECTSSQSLDITFVGPRSGLESFHAIASGIRVRDQH